MNREHSEQHAKQVDAWIKENVASLSSSERLQIFEAAFEAIQRRILLTLSDITLDAVLDRALYQSQQSHPLLEELHLNTEGLSFIDLNKTLSSKDSVEVTAAFRFFLIEIFTIVENLTAGIMIRPLYQELSQVSIHSKPTNGGEDI